MATQPNPAMQQGTQEPPYDPREDPTQPLGPNFENLKHELQLTIWNKLMEQERADEIPRRYEIKNILKRRLYFRGEQYWWYSDSQYMWFPPTQAPLNMPDYEPPAFQHVTNIIQPTALGLMATLSQSNTQAKFFPKSAQDEQQVLTAKSASGAVDLIHRNNDWQNLLDQMTYYMNTDGFIGGYVRYVSDGEMFGSEEQTIFDSQEVPLGNPQVQCPSCGYGEEGTTEAQPTCPDCGQPTSDVPAPTAQVPVPVGTVSIPNGQEVISVVGALQLKRNMWADDQKDFLYLEWIGDVHRARAMEKYPSAAEKIRNSQGAAGTTGSADSYERIARRLLYLGTGRHTGMILQDLGVFRRAWLRPAAFQTLTNGPVKEALQQLYPKGCHAVFYNDVYCESKNESMDEKWETMHTMPGEGQLRETLISALIPIQDQLNDCSNLLFETCMNGVPESFADQNTIDFEARGKQVAAPGNMTPIDLQPGQDIRSKIFFSQAVEPSVTMMKYLEQLRGEILQFISGYFPALFGGDTGSNDTASGIAAQKNQSMGRLGRVWRRLRIFCANLDGKSVRCFAQNRTQDVEIPKQSRSGGFDSDQINIEDMQGEIVAYPDVDAQYPTMQADIREMLLNFFDNVAANPLFAAVAQQPENLEYIFDTLGVGDLQVPGEQQRKKTSADIEQLLQEQPQAGMQQPPKPGQPPMPPQPVPSVMPDPLVDNLPQALATTKEWLISDKGMEAKIQNPPGYQNVYLYCKAIDQLQKAQEFSQAIAAQGLSGKGPGAEIASGGSEHIQPPPPNDPNAAADHNPTPGQSQAGGE